MQPILFYTVGYPGAGKTTLAGALTFWLKGEHLRGDKIGLELFRFPTFSPAERQAVHQEMQYRAGEALKSGQHVLYDAATNTEVQRAAVVALAKRYNALAVGLWVQVPTEKAMKRAGRMRDSGVAGPVARIIPPQIFMQYVQAFEAPQNETGVITVSGDMPFALQYRRLSRQLRPYGVRLPKMIQ